MFVDGSVSVEGLSWNFSIRHSQSPSVVLLHRFFKIPSQRHPQPSCLPFFMNSSILRFNYQRPFIPAPYLSAIWILFHQCEVILAHRQEETTAQTPGMATMGWIAYFM
jgi:hypothetical protein